mmetsp:Transcript_5997/g.10189  ORF Transcript_5997/g.10189 Transcript_5997/m.10189 type:complete len:110 (+) Transcript_5997:1374-1703(+)
MFINGIIFGLSESIATLSSNKVNQVFGERLCFRFSFLSIILVQLAKQFVELDETMQLILQFSKVALIAFTFNLQFIFHEKVATPKYMAAGFELSICGAILTNLLSPIIA